MQYVGVREPNFSLGTSRHIEKLGRQNGPQVLFNCRRTSKSLGDREATDSVPNTISTKSGQSRTAMNMNPVYDHRFHSKLSSTIMVS